MGCTFLKTAFATVALSIAVNALAEEGVPSGYELLIDEDFEGGIDPKEHLEMSDPAAWRVGEDEGNGALELYQQSEYEGRVRSPYNIALFRDSFVGSFVLEANLKQTGREYGHRDMCVFFGAKDPSNFYYIHIASVADPHAHNIFLVNDEARVAIASKTTDGAEWGSAWHKIRVERDIESGEIKLYFDDMDTPIMEATDAHFDFGYVGFGSFDDTGMIDNVKLWGQQSEPRSSFFR